MQTFSENILISVVRSQQHLHKHWKITSELFLPVIPLLASLALSTNRLGQLISSVIDPDADNRMPTITIIKSNVVWLFSRDNHFRSEGLHRLTYMLQKMENAANYLPNINHVRDVLQANLCLVNPITNQSMGDELDNINEYDSLRSLLAMLTSDTILDRSLRHQALAQIDFMALDAKCADTIHGLDGIRIVVGFLDKALQVNTYAVFANDATLVVSILRKVCVRIPQARAQLANDIHAYTLLLRALLLFQHDDTLRRNGAALLFMLAFNEYIAGGTLGDGSSVEPILSKLNAPIECEYRWRSSNQDPFTALFSPSAVSETDRSFFDKLGREQSLTPVERLFEHRERCWRYIRMAFASIWFGSLDKCNISNSYLHGGEAKLNYKINPHALAFSQALHIQTIDLDIIAGTSPLAGIQYWMKQIQSSTSSNQVADSLAAIESFSNVGAIGHGAQWSYDSFLDAIRRFCTTMPSSRCDEHLFIGICRLLANFIERDSMKVLLWALGEFNREKCVFIELLKAPNLNVMVFRANALFVEAVLMKTIQTPMKKHFEQLTLWKSTNNKQSTAAGSKKSNQASNLYEKIFDILLGLLHGMIEARRFGEFLFAAHSHIVLPTYKTDC